MIEQFYDLRPEVLALDRKALDLCRAQFAHVEEIRDYNQLKMLRAFTDCGVEARHFWGSSGYGVWDDSCLLYTSPSPRDMRRSRMPSSA